MSYLVTVTFDIKDAKPEDYTCLNPLLEKQALKKTLKSEAGNEVELPSNTYAAVVDGKSSKELREAYTTQIGKAFDTCEISGKFLVTVGDYWTWSVRTKPVKKKG